MVPEKNETLKEILQILDEKGPMTVDDIVNIITPPEVLVKDLSAGIKIRKVIKKHISAGKRTGAGEVLLRKDQHSNIYISKAGSKWLAGSADSVVISAGIPELKSEELDQAIESFHGPEGQPALAADTRKSRRFLRQLRRFLGSRFFVYSSALSLSVAILALTEMRTSFIQSYLLSDIMSRVTWSMANTESRRIEFPKHGPFDERLGYPMIPTIVDKLKGRDFEVTRQAEQSPMQYELLKRGIHAIYEEKHQGGLTILSSDNRAIFSSVYPQHYYDTFESIPPVIVKTLLVIENRDLLLLDYPYKNPVFDWGRLGKAIFDFGVSRIREDHDVPGGSTLATQIEKFRHSPEGRTHSVKEKATQMVSASLRAYRMGRSTFDVRKRILQDYVNSVPLGAIPGAGEIRGLPHGLISWHGVDFNSVNALLKDLDLKMNDDEGMDERALAYKQALSLFISQRRPAYYLQQDREALKKLVNRHLNLLVDEEVISKKFAKKVAEVSLTFRNNKLFYKPEKQSFIDRKATDAIRIYLLGMFQFDRLYTLDRLDMTVKSTIDYRTQKKVTDVLRKLSDPVFASENGLMDNRLLAKGNPAEVIYSVNLREIIGNKSFLRVQSDNIDGPFNVNDGTKLELGSTAKFRTIVSYLQIIEIIWRKHFDAEAGKLRPDVVMQNDRLTQWTVSYIKTAEDKSLRATLDAAMNRMYSANPTEKFFTGGGVHKFSNFTKDDDVKVVTMYEALRKSINLPFIRLMRDVVQYYSAKNPESEAMVRDVKNKTRKTYLENFARKEGRQFLNKFYLQFRGKKPDDIVRTFLKRPPTLKKVTNLFVLTFPDGSPQEFMAFAQAFGGPAFSRLKFSAFESSLNEYRKPIYSLQDRGVIAGVHPLELWCAAYLYNNPLSTYTATIQSGDKALLDSYQWLFQSKEKGKQDKRIKIILENEAFQDLHSSWVRVGYPFSFLVPTLATSIGSSGDKPSALAELMGIVLSNGYRTPVVRIEEISMAEGTPFETKMKYRGPEVEPVRVVSEDVAFITKKGLLDVVETGTAQRVKGAFLSSDLVVIPVGGKTGTGDNKFSVYAPGGRIVESKTKSRTATFVFFIGDRFYGTLTAYVPSASAREFNFTSALPVQILKILAPSLTSLIDYQPVEANSPWR